MLSVGYNVSNVALQIHAFIAAVVAVLQMLRSVQTVTTGSHPKTIASDFGVVLVACAFALIGAFSTKSAMSTKTRLETMMLGFVLLKMLNFSF